jgi:hypothetical protein
MLLFTSLTSAANCTPKTVYGTASHLKAAAQAQSQLCVLYHMQTEERHVINCLF